ncbi:MAG: SoxR reducing system RseC family protein [Candidatus Margulisiibacteriota bacterium]|nr:SoxR reducing system RseC family protein [Candidatus Margulisiibacteriota bacterium]
MRERGVVSRVISPKLVEVAFKRSEACEKCRMCHNLEEGMVGIESVNEISAKKDDIVEIEIPSGEVVKGSLVVFLVPILLMIFGYLLGALVNEFAGVINAILFLFLSFFVIRWYDKNIQQKEALRARILKII